MKWLLLVLGILVALVAIVALIGTMLAKAHSAARFRQPPEAIWRAITDVEAFPSWRADVKSVERLPDRNGGPAWRETDKHGQVLPLEVIEWDPPRKLVGRINDPKLPFGGTWTYEIALADGGCALTITENGEIYNPIFRFMARFVFGYSATMEGYLRSLGKKYGEIVNFEAGKAN
jgi:hypothetical protein